MKKVLILTSSLIKGTGGVASIVELGENLIKLKNNVNYSTTSYKEDNHKSKKIIDLSYIRFFELYNSGSKIKYGLSKVYSFFKLVFAFLDGNIKLIKNFDYILVASNYNVKVIRFLKKNTKAKLIFNHPADYELMKLWLSDTNLMDNSFYKEYLFLFDHVLFQSEFQMKDCYNITNLDNLTFINPICDHNSIDEVLNSDNQEIKKKFNNNSLNVLVTGTVFERKNQLVIAEQMSKLSKKSTLHLVGKIDNQDYMYKIDNISKSNPQFNVLFHGFKNDFLFFLKYSDVFINFSSNEGVSRSLREAMYCDKLIIASDIPGSKEYLKDGSGTLIDYNSPNLIYDELKKINKNENCNISYPRKSREVYLKYFDQIIYKEKLNKLFK
ncbi:glycosyltransferase [Flavobacteriaceae bacterium]|nr:glycosyltransferase [Flavobacteriaceae bacterium]